MSAGSRNGGAVERLADRRRPRSRSRPNHQRVWAVYGVLAGCLAAYVVSVIARRAGASSPWLDNWGVAGFELLVSGLCLMRAFVSQTRRMFVIALGLGLLSWSLGDLVLAIESSGGASPHSPSAADAFYLAFYPLTYIALTLFLRQQTRRLTVATWLDGAVAGLGAAALCAAFAFHHVLAFAGGSATSVATNLAYPIGDVLLLAIVVTGTVVLPARRKTPWLMLAGGYLINATGDTFNLFHSGLGTSHIGTLINAVAWPASILLVSSSVWLKPSPSNPLAEDWAPGFTLPGLAASAALAILVVSSLHHVGSVAVALAVATLLTAGGRFGLSMANLRALTAERYRQAVTDQLTGLSNRRALFQVLDAFFAEQGDPELEPRQLAFLFIDLNGFREINDSFGHAAGDELLQKLGSRLTGALRSGDFLVRLGGDEFAMALLDSDIDAAATVAQRLSARLEEPFVLEALRTRVGASIGIAAVPIHARSAADLLRCADLAMYRAKLARTSFAIYQEDLDGNGDRMRLVEELRLAINDGQLELHYQPQVDLASKEIVAVEALVRWPHPRLGFVPPLAFLPLAEEAGLMSPLTAFVLEEALAQCAAWRSGGSSITVSVNISATSLLETGFVGRVTELLDSFRLDPSALVLEVTETTAIADFDRSKRCIRQLRDVGIVVSVDDFGAGFTSLAYLSSLAVGELKLDRSFITGLATADGARDLTLVRSTIDLAHALGLRVVAEGVEDEQTLNLLVGLGCDLAQGYLISRPKPPAELLLAPSRAVAARSA